MIVVCVLRIESVASMLTVEYDVYHQEILKRPRHYLHIAGQCVSQEYMQPSIHRKCPLYDILQLMSKDVLPLNAPSYIGVTVVL